MTDAIDRWDARATWTFDLFRQRYGTDLVHPGLGFDNRLTKATSLSAFLDYVVAPERGLGGRTGPADEERFYLMGWYAFQRHPELMGDVRPAPDFVADWTLALPAKLRRAIEAVNEHIYWSIYVGPAGTRSPLHRDFGHTCGYLAQIRGRKRVWLFPPTEGPRLYEGQVDPARPDLERFPLFAGADGYSSVLGEGEVLFTPPRWWHAVDSLTPSITVSHNFFNALNVRRHAAFTLSRVRDRARAELAAWLAARGMGGHTP
jgi:hypothetical protein